mmetsp:Transcript_16899/g.25564  ORF Transcript_16899/g.25564 Transcript_16899/m.25564 type:complete len:247 (-) Transcript_16899:77-817(-)|eukprot:CAMPEP_0178913766 /NCGR_PEP_ID=MMETSP0786-20121207/11027_1 /TAXON_ID=186022 /ORGANISM="Thalassionema frauenfeldii, Strain CCMP 1798" /LENGTH=246 /DNA_ID=CAMNT_0020586549 /DNA_START=54 /DNA_END=794 /DNA_ORIENTATION=-
MSTSTVICVDDLIAALKRIEKRGVDDLIVALKKLEVQHQNERKALLEKIKLLEKQLAPGKPAYDTKKYKKVLNTAKNVFEDVHQFFQDENCHDVHASDGEGGQEEAKEEGEDDCDGDEEENANEEYSHAKDDNEECQNDTYGYGDHGDGFASDFAQQCNEDDQGGTYDEKYQNDPYGAQQWNGYDQGGTYQGEYQNDPYGYGNHGNGYTNDGAPQWNEYDQGGAHDGIYNEGYGDNEEYQNDTYGY